MNEKDFIKYVAGLKDKPGDLQYTNMIKHLNNTYENEVVALSRGFNIDGKSVCTMTMEYNESSYPQEENELGCSNCNETFSSMEEMFDHLVEAELTITSI